MWHWYVWCKCSTIVELTWTHVFNIYKINTKILKPNAFINIVHKLFFASIKSSGISTNFEVKILYLFIHILLYLYKLDMTCCTTLYFKQFLVAKKATMQTVLCFPIHNSHKGIFGQYLGLFVGILIC